MATLQKIRNNAGLLVSIVIGMALIAFILGDLLKAGGSMFGASRTDVAEIAGTSVSIQNFQQKIDENVENYKRNYGESSLDQATMQNVQEQTWEQVIREYVMLDEFDELGVQVSGDELFDMVQGNNIHPQIMQIPIFINQETSQFDRNLVIQFLKSLELDPSGANLSLWTSFEKGLAQEQLNTKYNTLIQKGLFITSAQAKSETIKKNTKINFDYIVVPYNTVADSVISFTEAEVAKYYNKNSSKYEQDEECEINYVTFPVIASQEDDAQTRKLVAELIPEFKTIENFEQFINLNSDAKFDGKYFSKEELPILIASIFEAENGTIVGPYKEENAYKIAKVVNTANIPDSVEARHILISPDQIGMEAAVALGDSLLNVVENGGNFAELAKKFSADGSAQEGGSLGWFTEGAMVKPFNDACFLGQKGDIVSVQSQFGIHVIEVLNQAATTEKVQVAILTRHIEASSKTFQNTYAAASKFGGSNRTYDEFMDAAEKKKLNPRYAKFGKNDKQVANLESPRPMIRWAFKVAEGDVSEIFEFGDVYVVAAIKKLYEEGTAPLENVKVDIEREIKKLKKAEYLVSKIEAAKSGAATLQTVANALSTDVRESVNADFSAYQIPGLGFEPEVQGVIASLPKEQISNPVEGNRGVYLVQVKNVVEPAENIDFNRERSFLSTSISSRVRYEVYNAIKEASDINDNRSTFY